MYEKIATEAKQANNIGLEVKAQNGLADCYTDLGVYYKSNVLLKENLKLLNASRNW